MRLSIVIPTLDEERGLPDFEPGDVVILGYLPTTNTYFYEDQDRSTSLFVLAVLFVVIVVAFGRARGLFALFSMAITVAIFVGFIAPSVLGALPARFGTGMETRAHARAWSV